MLTVEKVRKRFSKRATKDKKKVATYMEYTSIMQVEYIKRFGKGFKWEDVPIKDKTYHGWLRPILISSDALINGRWSYWLDIRTTQKVEGKPIPQLNFHHPYDEKFRFVSKMIEKCLNPPLNMSFGGYQTFLLFVDWLLYGWGSPLVKEFPSQIDDSLNEYWYKNFQGDLMLMFPADYFMNIASEMYGGKGFNSNQFYPTPSVIVEFMVDILMSGAGREAAKYAKKVEPCCGSGIMLLYMSNWILRLQAVDIDLLMIKLTHLNGYFYIPWLMGTDDKTNSLLENMYIKYNPKEIEENIKYALEINKKGQLAFGF
ncbi:MAG: hypothetical protein MJA82_18320 [Clostridia bacterium]|nr:hypothetical protein [Clostridia bacterium]